MRKIYHQPYTKKRATIAWYGKPPKDVFEYDVIRVQLPDDKGDMWMTPDEAADFIRAVSAGLHHFLCNDKSVKHIIKAKTKAD